MNNLDGEHRKGPASQREAIARELSTAQCEVVAEVVTGQSTGDQDPGARSCHGA